MKRQREYKLRRQAELAGVGFVLDLGFAANPNPFLQNPIGLDLVLPKQCPTNYQAMWQCNLNLENIPCAHQTFDAVIVGDLIEHLENPCAFLRDVNRVLKPYGRLVLCTPQANDWWTTCHNWFFRRWINDPDQGEHLQNWTILDMQRLLKKNGFTVSSIEGVQMRFPYLTWYLPIKNFPILSWQVLYVTHKTHLADNSALGFVDGNWQKVDQCGTPHCSRN